MVCKKATQTHNFLQRNLRLFTGNQIEGLQNIHKLLTIMNYSSTVKNPDGEGNQGLRDRLEMVQRKSARFVFADWRRESSPTTMINQLGWKCLEAQ